MYKPKLTLITGASAGLGYEFSRLCANLGSDLILISRNNTKLIQIKENFEKEFKIKVYIIPCDLIKSESLNIVINYLKINNLYPNLFINNAGIGLYGNFIESNIKIEEEMIHLNIFASTILCNYILNRMLINKNGIILNVSSTVAFRQSPNWSVYAASKSYLYSLTKSLALEFKKSGIKIFALCPGKINTDFDKNAGNPDFNNKKKRSSEFIANYALNKIEKNKTIIIPGFENKLKYMFFKYCPEIISNFIISINNKKS